MSLRYPSEAALRKSLNIVRDGSKEPRTSPVASPETPDALTAFLEALQGIAIQNAWSGQWSFNGRGSDAGLHCLLVRDTEILYVEIPLPGHPLRPSQVRDSQRWQATGKVEVYAWTLADLPAITQRLALPRREGRHVRAE